jgi:hypothetical protein
MDKELVIALQCGIRLVDGTAGGYTEKQAGESETILARHGIMIARGSQNAVTKDAMFRMLTAELAKPMKE